MACTSRFEGLLVAVPGHAEVYLVVDEERHHIPTLHTKDLLFGAAGWPVIYDPQSANINMGKPLGEDRGIFQGNDGRRYLSIQTDTPGILEYRWIINPEVYDFYGFKWNDWTPLPPGAKYGKDITCTSRGRSTTHISHDAHSVRPTSEIFIPSTGLCEVDVHSQDAICGLLNYVSGDPNDPNSTTTYNEVGEGCVMIYLTDCNGNADAGTSHQCLIGNTLTVEGCHAIGCDCP